MNHFEHDYVIPSPLSAQDKVLCMRCGALIAEGRYDMQRRFNSKEEIAVYAIAKSGSYRQVPIAVEEAGRNVLMHVLTCEDCQTFDLTPEIGEKIMNQIRRGAMAQVRWSGLPEEAAEAMYRKYSAMKILRRLQGEELVKLYQREGRNASNI